MAKELAHTILDRFVQRRDVYAIQYLDGSYSPVHAELTHEVIQTHLDENFTYGHYTTDPNNRTRIIAFDCDLRSQLHCMTFPDTNLIANGAITDENILDAYTLLPYNSIETYWFDRYSLHTRAWLKYKMRYLAEVLTTVLRNDAGMDCAAFYSGNKGIHVYGFFPGHVEASNAREIGKYVLQKTVGLISHNCYLTENPGGYTIGGPGTQSGQEALSGYKLDHIDGMPYFNIEVYPKQDQIPEGGYGNLLRLPLGRNLHSLSHDAHGNELSRDRALPDTDRLYNCQPAFLIDQCTAILELLPHPDPLAVLQSGNPWVVNTVSTGVAK